ncbi:MAG: phenylalanine--tRNA ligase beta subunit-related protein [Anaerolineaceae bacterium]
MIFEINDKWRRSHPGACVGNLLLNMLENPAGGPGLAALEERRLELEARLREQFEGKTRADIAALPGIQAYSQYYRRFDKSYVVQLQLESIVFKGKSIPSISGLVEAMFMAEIKNQLLTAGHDADKLNLPVTLNSAAGNEEYTLLRGTSQALKAGDMFMSDREGVISSIIYGPDQRTQISPATRRALFAVYAPAGVGENALRSHLADIVTYVRVFSPEAQVEFSSVFNSDG